MPLWKNLIITSKNITLPKLVTIFKIEIWHNKDSPVQEVKISFLKSKEESEYS